MIGVFLALDTFLFYIFWEVVLVPMYLIIGIWGGANRIYATIKFVLYTLVGSLLMLVAILATAFAFQSANGGLVDGRLRLRGPAGLRAAVRRRAPADRVPRLLPRVRDQGPDVPVPHLAARRPHGGADGGLGDPGRRHAQARRLRVHPVRRAPLPGRGRDVRAGDHRAVAHRDHLRGDRGPRPAGPQTAGGVLVGQPHGLRDPGHLRVHRAGPPGRGPPDDQPRPDHGRPVPARRGHLRAHPRPDDRQDERPVRADAGLGGRVRVLRVRLGRAARAVRVRRRVPGPPRHVRGPAVRRRGGDLRDDPGRRLPAVDVRAPGLRRGVRLPRATSAIT